MKYLQPNFKMMPKELIEQPRWVCWKGAKIPFDPLSRNKHASVIDPYTWMSFEQAQTAYEEGGYRGVGFVLNGDGIVGIDIDHCVRDGLPSAAALQFMTDIGCQYFELSPSGTGLHGFGYAYDAPKMGRLGTFNGLKVELYSGSRYFTMTGHPLMAGSLAPLVGYQSAYDQLHRNCSPTEVTEDTEVAEVIECNTSVSPTGIIDLPVQLMPTGPGQRNGKVFALARHLKSIAPSVSMEELKPIVQEWHRRSLPVIRTKDWYVTWVDFKTGWDNAKYLSGTLNSVMSNLPEIPPDCSASEYGPNSEKLFQICLGLQQHQGENSFFLSCTIAGHLIGIDRSDAAKVLKLFCNIGLLELVSKGIGKKASRYKVLKLT